MGCGGFERCGGRGTPVASGLRVARSLRVALALAAGLVGCTGSRPEAGPVAPVVAVDAAPSGWWQGTWRLDAERLAAPGELAALDGEARAMAAALAIGLAPAVRFDLEADALVRTLGTSVTREPFTVEAEGERVVLRLAGGGRLALVRQGEARASLVEGTARAIPVVRGTP